LTKIALRDLRWDVHSPIVLGVMGGEARNALVRPGVRPTGNIA